MRHGQLWSRRANEYHLCAGQQAGGHEAALRILALLVGDVAAAEAYCAAHLGPPGYAQLLALLLDARLLPEACHLLRFAGAPAVVARVGSATAKAKTSGGHVIVLSR